VGVGAALQRWLAADGITLVGQLATIGERELAARYSQLGTRLAHRARGVDDRAVLAHAPARSISAETTLAKDEVDAEVLSHALWPLCDRVSGHLKETSLAAGSVTLKLKTGDFRLRTRSRRLADPTQLAETLFRAASALLASEADGVTSYRLIGVGADLLVDGSEADLPTLFDDELGRAWRLEQTIDEIRGRLGDDSVRRGRDLTGLSVRSAAEIGPHAVPRERE
jgi:DNA polymerase IV